MCMVDHGYILGKERKTVICFCYARGNVNGRCYLVVEFVESLEK